jgi:ribonuclease HI
MKTLKLDHKLAELVQRGKKTSTWRLYDDKDLSVGDEVEFIDKVDPHDRTTWVPAAVGHITQIIEKRIQDLTPEDKIGHEEFNSADQLIDVFRSYYGNGVTGETPVKIVHFDAKPVQNADVTETTNDTQITEVKLYADGGSRGNPGPSASGYVLYSMDDKVLVEKGVYLGITTNNQAEYLALKFGLEEAQKMNTKTVHVYMDSLLVVNQMLGKFKVKNRDLWPIHTAIKELEKTFHDVRYTHVPRALNKDADAQVNKALDKAAEDNLPLEEVI